MHLIPQTELHTHVVRHPSVPQCRPIQRARAPRRIRQASLQLVLADRRLRRCGHEPRILIGGGGVVVDAHVAVAAADLKQVVVHSATAVPVAGRPAAEGGRADVVVAVALGRVLDAAEAEAAAVADVLAEGDGHVGVVGDEVAHERADEAGAVVVAAEILLVSRGVCLADGGFERGDWGRVDGLSDLRLDDVGRAVHRGGCCGLGAVGDFHTPWEFGNEALYLLVDLRRPFRAVEAKRVRLAFLQNWASGNLAKVVRGETVDCCIRKDDLIPAILEIGVEAIASGITLGKDEQAILGLVRHILNVVEDFEEDVRDLYWVGGRADTIVDAALVSDVRVVLLVQISPVPAALKMNLGTHAVLALCAVHVWFLDDDVVYAVETDSISDRPTRVLLCAVCRCLVVVTSC